MKPVRDHVERPLVQQRHQPVRRPFAQRPFGGAGRAAQFGRVDPGDAHGPAAEPETVAVDHAGRRARAFTATGELGVDPFGPLGDRADGRDNRGIEQRARADQDDEQDEAADPSAPPPRRDLLVDERPHHALPRRPVGATMPQQRGRGKRPGGTGSAALRYAIITGWTGSIGMADEPNVERTTIVETDGGGGGGGGVLAVVLLVIVVLVLLFLFRDQLGFGGSTTEVNIPDKIEVNVN